MSIVSPDSSIPCGYRFRPTSEEILCYYLKPAINGEPLPSRILIQGHVYGENREPWKIFDKHVKESFWVFTKLEKKSELRIDRTAGRGCWLGRNIKEIKNVSGQLLGFDKYFTFTCKKDDISSQGNGHWVMHEFSLSDEGLSDYVVCEIKNKDVAVSLDHQEDEVKAKNKNHQESQDPNWVQTMTSTSFPDYAHLEELENFSDKFEDFDTLLNGRNFDEFTLSK